MIDSENHGGDVCDMDFLMTLLPVWCYGFFMFWYGKQVGRRSAERSMNSLPSKPIENRAFLATVLAESINFYALRYEGEAYAQWVPKEAVYAWSRAKDGDLMLSPPPPKTEPAKK